MGVEECCNRHYQDAVALAIPNRNEVAFKHETVSNEVSQFCHALSLIIVPQFHGTMVRYVAMPRNFEC